MARIRPWVLLAVAVASVGLAAPACQDRTSNVGLTSREEDRLETVETTVAQVSGTATRLNDELIALQQSLQGRDEGLAGEIAGLKGSLEEFRRSLGALQKDLAAAKGADATLQKKLDELAGKLAGVDQRLWVLQARYDDHLRKYHGGG